MPSRGWRRAFRIDVGKRRIARDVDHEIAFHVDMRTRKLIAHGMNPVEAAAKALEQFGDLPSVRDECVTIDVDRERSLTWSDRWNGWRQDLRHAFRSLAHQPVFTLAVVALLAIGIGANTAIFTLIDALLLRPLPVHEPDRLITIGDPAAVSDGWNGSPQIDYVSYPVYKDVRDRNSVLSGVYATGATGSLDVRIPSAGADVVDHPRGRLISGSFFSVLGVPAYIGRTFADDEDRTPLGDPIVMISYGYWQRFFGGDQSVLGRTITVNGVRLAIVGVTPPWFRGDVVGYNVDVWVPMMMQPVIRVQRSVLDDRTVSWLLMMGRLKPGVTIERARAELTVIETRSLRTGLTGIELTRFNEDLVADPVRIESGARGFSPYRSRYGPALGVLMTAVALIVLIVCANVANLMLARATARRRDMMVRLALGGSRARLIQKLIIENTLIAVAAAAVGLVLASWGSRLLLAMASTGPIPIPVDVAPNGPIMAFTAGVTLVSTMLFGLLPALRSTRVDVASALCADGRSLAGARGRIGRFSAGQVLVVCQVALSMVLLVGTGVFARSMQRMLTVDLGFDRERLIVADVSAGKAGYAGERRLTLAQELVSRFERVPGVAAVSLAENGVFSGGYSEDHIAVPGFVARADSDLSVASDVVGSRYFGAVGARIVRGRELDERDTRTSERVAVINETMAKRYFDQTEPIGRTVIKDSVTYTIVGVVHDVSEQKVRAKPQREMYTSLVQLMNPPRHFVVVARATGRPSSVVSALRAAIRATDPKLEFDIDPVDDLVRTSIAQDVLVARVVAFFGVLALVLAAIGLYGVLAYATMQRTGELGLRVALGAEPTAVMRMILRQALGLAFFGLAIGLPIGLVATRFIREQLFGMSPIDVPSLSIAILVLIVTTLVASYVPARRAARVDPLEALRAD